MCPLYEGIPAVIYSGLWVLKIFKKLEKLFPKTPVKVIFLLIDSPPAFSVKIDKCNFEIEILNEIKDPKDLEDIECDGYLALPTELLYKGVEGIRKGLGEQKVKLKNFETLAILGKLAGFR